MSRLAVWICTSAAGLAYWGLAHDFSPAWTDHFAGPFWFGGMALLVHWFTNRAALKESPHG